MLLIVPSAPGQPQVPEPHFYREVAACQALGHETAVLDYDTLQADGAPSAVESIAARKTTALYRDSKTGQIVTEEYAKKHPATTEREVRKEASQSV